MHVATGYIGRNELLWTQELDERIILWKHTTLPMPQGHQDTALPSQLAKRLRIAEKVRCECKRLPHKERLTYLNRMREAPFSLAENWHRDLYAFLSWEEVRDLDRRGFSIGSHTVNHPILTTISPSELDLELGESKSCIERELGKPCPWFAYPNGGSAHFSPEAVAAVKRAGYRIAFTLMGKPNAESLRSFEIDRVGIPGELSENAFHARMNGFLTLIAG